MRHFYVVALCAFFSACAGSEQVQVNGKTMNVGPTRAIQSSYAFAAPAGSSAVHTTGRAIGDLKTYRALKANHPELFRARSGQAENALAIADRINQHVNDSITFEDDSPSNESWRVLASGGYGDCDDYAVTKLAKMVQAGVPRHALRLTVATSKITGEWHLMLAVDTARGTYFLDNNNAHLLNSREARNLYTLWFMENPRAQQMELVS